MLKIKDVEGYQRDEETGAILSTDKGALTAYKQKRDKERKIEDTMQEVRDLKTELADLKRMLAETIKVVEKVIK